MLCGALYAFFNYTRIGVAMQATSQNQLAAYYMGIPVKLIFSLIWAISAGVAARRRHPAGAGVADRHQHGLPRRSRRSPRRCWAASARSPARWWAASSSASSSARRATTCRGLQGHRALHRAAADADRAAAGPVRPQRPQEGVGGTCAFLFKTSYDQDIRLFRDTGDVFWYGAARRRCCSLPAAAGRVTTSASRVRVHLRHRAASR